MFKYLCISIVYVTPTGDRNKYKLETSIHTCISSVQYMRNPNKNKFVMSIRSNKDKSAISVIPE